jgi:phosphoglycolate phosphatase
MKQDIRMIVFDWDGTLVDNMGVKAQSFAESVIQLHPDLDTFRKNIEQTYYQTRGSPRFDQLALIQDQYSLPQLSRQDRIKWSAAFTGLYSDKQSPLFSGVMQSLSTLSNKYKLSISSGVPQKDLDESVAQYGISKYFSHILGFRNDSFKKGISHFTYISEKSNIPLECMVMIGDGTEDIRVAKEAGVLAIGKADGRMPSTSEELLKENPARMIYNISELVRYII